MDLAEIFRVVLLGLIEGLTEFLPVSSTGHLILAGAITGFEGPASKLFDIVIQLGAILAVLHVYRARLWHAFRDSFRDPAAFRFNRNILLAFLPSAVIGVLAYRTIKAHLMNAWTVSIALLLGGIAILVIERLVKPSHRERIEDFSPALSIRIGLLQCLAMIPGVSRSGATIMGSLLMGVERKTAAEFSFFLAIPTMTAAALYDLIKSMRDLNGDGMEAIAIGFAAAYFSALVVVRGFVGFVSRHGFAPFAWYRIVLGAAGLAVLIYRA